MAELYGSIMDATKDWLVKAGEIALQLLAVTAVIGFAIGVKDLVLSGHVTLDGIVALFVRFAFIVGLIVWLLNAPQRLALIPQSIKKIGSAISGQNLGFGSLMTLFSDITTPLVEFTTGLSWTDVGLIICMAFIIFLINCLSFAIAATVLVVEVESVFILIGGLFTASFFVIGYFRDLFLSYIKALAAVGMKMLMLSLCLGTMRNIMSTWPALIAAQLESAESVFSFLTPMSCALLGFYMILKAVPQFAASVLTGSVSGMDGGMVKSAAMAGIGLGTTVISTSRTLARGVMGGTGAVSQAAQAYQYTSQAAKDTGSTSGEAKAAGAQEALRTVMLGSRPGGSRTVGERIYSDAQRSQQFSDVRNSGANTMGSPGITGWTKSLGTSQTASASGGSISDGTTPGNVVETSAVPVDTALTNPTLARVAQGIEPYKYPSSGGSGIITASGLASSGASSVGNAKAVTDSWGSFASDRKKKEGKN
jgi:type IV secretory pathway TrbL component